MRKNLKSALINSFSTFLYIVLIGAFMYYGSMVKIGKASQFLAPIAMLLLFVFSAAVTGSLIFGKPILMYFEGKKKDALQLLIYTLISLLIITILILTLLVGLNLNYR